MEVFRAAPPIFIVGPMRSGTTLMRLILDAHPDIAVGPESMFARAIAHSIDIPDWQQGARWFERFGESEDRFKERLRELYSGFFQDFAARQGKSRWGEKTPAHLGYAELLASVFPEARFIAMIRHPGAVSTSLGRWGHSVEDAVDSWVHQANLIKKSVSVSPGSWHLVRYEDLVSKPEPTLREVVEFLGVRWSADMLGHGQVHRRKGSPAVTDGDTVTHDEIDVTKATRWTGSASPELYGLLDNQRDILLAFGYTARAPMPTAALAPPFRTADQLPGPARVPDNRWDLMTDLQPPPDWEPTERVTVIVTPWGAPGQLDDTLRALEAQTYPASLVEVLVLVGRGREKTALDIIASEGGCAPRCMDVDADALRRDIMRTGALAATTSLMVYVASGVVPYPTWLRAHAHCHSFASDVISLATLPLTDARTRLSSSSIDDAVMSDIAIRRRMFLIVDQGDPLEATFGHRAWQSGAIVMRPAHAALIATITPTAVPRLPEQPKQLRVVTMCAGRASAEPIIRGVRHLRAVVGESTAILIQYDRGGARFNHIAAAVERNGPGLVVVKADRAHHYPWVEVRIAVPVSVELRRLKLAPLLDALGRAGLAEVKIGDAIMSAVQTRALNRAARLASSDVDVTRHIAELFGRVELEPQLLGLRPKAGSVGLDTAGDDNRREPLLDSFDKAAAAGLNALRPKLRLKARHIREIREDLGHVRSVIDAKRILNRIQRKLSRS